MPDVLIYADTMRAPDLRHEVPVAVPDPFLYLERNGEKHAVLTSFEVDRVSAAGIHAHPLEEFGWDEILAQGNPREESILIMLERAVEALGVREAVVPTTFPLEVADRLRAKGITLTPDREFFLDRRRAKNEAEIEGIRKAQRGTEAAMDAARDLLRRAETSNGTLVVDGEPLTCERLKTAITDVFNEYGLVSDEMIVAHGPQTAVGHDMGSGPISPNEPIVLDLFPKDRESGCYADMTRTFVVGEAPEELVEYHRLVKEALDRSLAATRPGETGDALMRLVSDLFHAHGHKTPLHKEPGEVLADGFFHSLGHGVGLEVHEAPSLGRNGEELLPGDVVTLEPGLYRSGYGGVRLEDLVLVTDDGAEVLTDYGYDLEL